MAKKIEGYIKLQVPAGQANPSPPIGPALGQRGVNIPEFCKQFNAATQKLEPGSPIPTVITVYADRSFTFEMRTPPASYLLKKAAKIGKGSTAPGSDRRRERDPGAAPRDRRGQDEGFERQFRRASDEDHRRLCPLDGSRGAGVDHEQTRQEISRRRREDRSREALLARGGGEAGQGTAPRRSSTRPSRSR